MTTRQGFSFYGSRVDPLLYRPADQVYNDPASAYTLLPGGLTAGWAFDIQADLASSGARVAWKANAGTTDLVVRLYDPGGTPIDTVTVANVDTTLRIYDVVWADPIRLLDYGTGTFVIAAWDDSGAGYFSDITATLVAPYPGGYGVIGQGSIYSAGMGVYPATTTAIEVYGVQPQFVRIS